jgi:hypothetical protein
MQRRGILALALLGGSVAATAQQRALPLRNLLVELRWSEARAQAAQHVAGQGGVVVGTAGGADVQGQVVARAGRRDEGAQVLQRLTVLNGSRAGVQLTEQVPLQWLELALTPRGPVGVLRQGWVDSGTRFELRPQWPGGAAPVTVEVMQGSGGGSVFTTLQMPLDEWVTVAQSAGAQRSEAGGTLSSRQAERHTQHLLQMRVSAP